jgi:dTDP-4-dehydrorhamnose reductase
VARLQTVPGLQVDAISRETHEFDARRPLDLRDRLHDADIAVDCVGVLRSDPTYGTPAFLSEATLVNALWPQFLALESEPKRCRVIHLSTDAVFGPGAKLATETTCISPCEPYGLSKALGEVHAPHVLNLRFSVIGPAPDRQPSLWEWLVRHPTNAVVKGYASSAWAGCTSAQLAWFISDLVNQSSFDLARQAGPVCHFVPNGVATKFEVLTMVAAQLRPDLSVVPVADARPAVPALASAFQVPLQLFTGRKGWADAIAELR